MGLFSRKKKGPTDAELERLKHDIKDDSVYRHRSEVKRTSDRVAYLRKLKSEVNSSDAHDVTTTHGQRMRMAAVIEYALVSAQREDKKADARLEAAEKLDNGNVNSYREGTILTTTFETLEAADRSADASHLAVADRARDKGGFPKRAPKKKVERYLARHTPGYFSGNMRDDFKKIADSVGTESVAKLK